MLKRMMFCLGCWALVASAGAWAQSADHLGGKIFAPPGVMQGGGSQFFVPGGTVFQNPNGSLITVPTQVFTPYPLTGQQFMQLTTPETPLQKSLSDGAQGVLGPYDPYTNPWGIGIPRMSRQDTIKFFGSPEDEAANVREGTVPTGPGFNPVPPSDMPTPSVDEVRQEIG